MKQREKISLILLLLLVIVFMGIKINSPVAVSFVAGSSMYPSLEPGDLVVLISTSISPPEKGDLVSYKKGDIFILHRLQGTTNNYAILQGDNNPFPDDPVPLSHLRYKMVAKIPRYVWAPLIVLLLFTLSSLLPKRGIYLYLVLLLMTVVIGLPLSALLTPTSSFKIKPVNLPIVTNIHYNNTTKVLTITFSSQIICMSPCTQINDTTIQIYGEANTVIVPVKISSDVNITLLYPVMVP